MTSSPHNGRPGLSRKGSFAQGRLPVARRYVAIDRRRKILLLGLGLTVAFAVWALANGLAGEATLLSSGPLSSAHANLGGQCSSCHVPGEGASDARCVECHEPGMPGGPAGPTNALVVADAPPGGGQQAPSTLTVAAHAARFGRSESAIAGTASCQDCHLEHLGRDHELARVADKTCRGCHDLPSFEKAHPQFAELTAPTAAPGSAPLAFSHVSHVQEVLRREAGSTVLGSCSSCHQPEGRGFADLDFATQCSACHLGPAKSTEWLPLASAGESGEFLGVSSLDELRGRLGAQWADELYPEDFSERRGSVRKLGLQHPDPWILENLREVRQRIYRAQPLADLLVATADSSRNTSADELYQEAIRSLEQRAARLRRSEDPATRAEARQVEALLVEARRKLEREEVPLGQDAFALAPRSEPLSALERSQLDELVAGLAGECISCHQLEQLTIVRPARNLSRFERAAFDHDAHQLQANCLECHDRIPELLALERGETVDAKAAAAAQDRAETANLPGVERCQSCHSGKGADASCTTCHGYHPAPDVRRSGAGSSSLAALAVEGNGELE